jgi:hypothetical protein
MKFALIFFLYLISKVSPLKSLNDEIIPISIISEQDIEFVVEPNQIYKLVIENQNYIYHFDEKVKDILEINNKENNLESDRKNLYFEKGDIIIINRLQNLKDTFKFIISSIPLYDKLNSFETLYEDKIFSIKSEEESIAYFDSPDKNTKIFISENDESNKKENIAVVGNFWKCSKGKTYIINVELFDISVLRKYFYPINLNSEINIKNDEQNFLYLQQSKSYSIIFEGNTMIKMIKLSDKTFDSVVTISKDGVELSTLKLKQLYFELGTNYNTKLTFEIKDSNAFLME